MDKMYNKFLIYHIKLVSECAHLMQIFTVYILWSKVVVLPYIILVKFFIYETIY